MENSAKKAAFTLYTVGHSSRSFEEFLKLLRAHGIGRIVDVRTVPKSRRVPWFNKEELAPALNEANIRYAYLPELGGLRHSKKDSINLGWKNESFRGFADYMATPEFEEGLRKLNEMLASAKPPIEKGAKPGLPNLKTAVMCAEAVPWRCHRSLISDAETVRGVQVEHLMSPTSILPHEMTSFAKVDKKSNPPKVTYPAQPKDPNQPGLPGMPEASPPKRSKKR